MPEGGDLLAVEAVLVEAVEVDAVGHEVGLEDLEEAVGDLVGLGRQVLPLVEDGVDGDAQGGEGRPRLDEAHVGHAHPAVVGEGDQPDLDGAGHGGRVHRPRREPLGQLGGSEDDLAGRAEQRGQTGLLADQLVEGAAPLPALDETGDAGERVPVALEPGDQPQPVEVGGAVPARAPLQPGARQQAAVLVEADGGGGHARLGGQLVDAHLGHGVRVSRFRVCLVCE